MFKAFKTFVIILLVWPTSILYAAKPQNINSNTLGMAIDYFQSGKYREALLLFRKIDKEYELNSRFLAYMGVCYFHIEEYRIACKYLTEQLPKLRVFAPAEQTIYYKTCAESHFILEEYTLAIPIYKEALITCRAEEKGDFYYKIGFCYTTINKYDSAYHYLYLAYTTYQLYPIPQPIKGRMIQIEKMLKGCKTKLEEKIQGINT